MIPTNSNGLHLEPDPDRSALDAAITRALERQPAVVIPADFASRAAARAVAEPQRTRSPWAGFGPRIAAVSGVLLTGTLFAFAAHAKPSFFDLRFDLELLLLVELGVVSYVVTRLGLRD